VVVLAVVVAAVAMDLERRVEEGDAVITWFEYDEEVQEVEVQ